MKAILPLGGSQAFMALNYIYSVMFRLISDLGLLTPECLSYTRDIKPVQGKNLSPPGRVLRATPQNYLLLNI